MSKDSLVKYYTKNKKEKQSFQRKLVKVMKIFLTKKKQKNDNMLANYIKISQKVKSKSWLSIEKNIINHEKIKMINK